MTDEKLVRAAQANPRSEKGRAAANELLHRYQKAVYLWSFRYVREHEHALDMAQDVLMTAYQKLASFEGRSKFSSWLFAMTRNRCLNEIKRVDLLNDDEPRPSDFTDRGSTPDELLDEKENRERILNLLQEALGPLEQQAIWLRCYERVPVDTITRLLGISTSSGARGVLQTARRKLRAAMPEGDKGS